MAKVDRSLLGWLVASLVVLVALFAFAPISGALLRAVHGSFAPAPYSALALADPEQGATGVTAGQSVEVLVTNRTGATRRYDWVATEDRTVISQGSVTVRRGATASFSVASRRRTSGRLKVALAGTAIFVTVPVTTS